ncbi:MAG TPA: hypothetical protein VHH11_17405 [Gammaproteobacteria bacterium]|nr:hypothetical protein [Gammaproteobacteria bacterium]
MRAFLLAALLAIVPVVVYWPTATHEYGFRDDYAHLRESHEEPGKLFRLTTSNGRPVYGAVLEASLAGVHDVPDLKWLRLTSIALLAGVGLVLFAFLRRIGWGAVEAAAVGAGVTLLPGAQVVVGWAIAWPISLGLLAAVAGFWLVEAHLAERGTRRVAGVLAGALLYVIAGLTYQTSALFAIVPLAALLLEREDARRFGHARWVVTHIGILFASLVVGLLAMHVVFSEGLVPEAARMHIEPEPLKKLLWFVRNPLPNALALFELRDRFATHAVFWVVTAVFGSVIALGFHFGGRGRSHKLRWLFCLLALPFVGHSVSLAASSQAIGYRTLLPMSGLFLVLLVYAMRSVVRNGGVRPATQAAALGALLVSAAVLAYHNAFTLIAEPQSREWTLFHSAAASLRLAPDTDVYIIRPTIEDRSTEQVYDDEFGSLSSDADWAAKEMFKTALRERFPAPVADGKSYRLETGPLPPTQPGNYDLVLDLRRLKAEGDRTVVAAFGQEATALRR